MIDSSADLDLLEARPLEAQVEAVVGERAHFGVAPVVAHADDGDASALDERDELLHAAAVLVARHAVHLVHQHAVTPPVHHLLGPRAAARTCKTHIAK